MGDSERARAKVLLSAYHLHASELFAVEAGRIESESGEYGPDGQSLYDYRAYVMASVLEAVAFLEAYTNELLAESSDTNPSPLLQGLSLARVRGLARVRSEMQLKRRPLLEKCDLMVEATDGRTLDHGDTRYVHAALLVSLRNYLVHFDGEWMEVPTFGGPPVPQRSRHGIEKALHGKFPRDRFTRKTDLFFPNQCLGSPCARWACLSAYQYGTWFAERIGALKCFFLRHRS